MLLGEGRKGMVGEIWGMGKLKEVCPDWCPVRWAAGDLTAGAHRCHRHLQCHGHGRWHRAAPGPGRDRLHAVLWGTVLGVLLPGELPLCGDP